MGALLLLGLVSTGLIINQIPLLIDAGITPGRAAVIQSVFGITVIVARFLTGLLLDRMSASLLMSGVCLGGIIACALYAAGISSAALFLAPVLIGGIIGAEFDVLSYMIKRSFGIRSYGRTYGVVYAVFQLGSAFGTPVLALSQRFTGTYLSGLVAYAVALLISGLCFVYLGTANVGQTASR